MLTDLKRKLRDEEGFPEVYEKIVTLALPTRGGPQETDCADIKTLLRVVQSIPSPKAEPFKQWLATVGYERIQETAQPSKAIERAIESFRKQGRDERWIEDRIKSIVGANEKTDQRGVEGKLYAALNAEMSEVAFGVTPAEHCEIKGCTSRRGCFPKRPRLFPQRTSRCSGSRPAAVIRLQLETPYVEPHERCQ